MVGGAAGRFGVSGLREERGGDGGSSEEAGLCGRGAGEPEEDGGQAAGERSLAAAPRTSQQVNRRVQTQVHSLCWKCLVLLFEK